MNWKLNLKYYDVSLDTLLKQNPTRWHQALINEFSRLTQRNESGLSYLLLWDSPIPNIFHAQQK